ncbi:MAG: integrase catalytic domain-containing protein [Dissulfurispiraceae bacterium]|jgi:hypothetical protein
MGLTAKERRSATKVTAARYQKATKKLKGIILEEFAALTGYDRCYAAYLLRTHGKKVYAGGNTIFVADVGTKATKPRNRVYDKLVFTALLNIWSIMDCICGKRLAPMLKELVPLLQKHREITLDAATKGKLLTISAATIDRMLRAERKKQQLKGRSHTKPGTLLKHQIPIRTFAQWDDKRPGFVEIDLVGHDGGDPSGDFAQTLNVTDIATGWTEAQAVKNKAQQWVFEAITDMRVRFPFDILGIDSDNGAEFINNHLYQYCKEEKITFTRARSSRKNDNCFIEQKNYSVVRRAVGYMRHDTQLELEILNELYGFLRLYSNFFQPVMKLLEKTRIGSKVKKKYDKAQTPYQRVLASPDVPKETKKQLRSQYRKLNPAELKRKIENLQQRLIQVASNRHKKRLQ